MNERSRIWILGLVALALVATALTLLAVAPKLVRAATHDVDVGDSIQDAIDSANPGDIIRVAAGTFTESLTIDKSLILEGGYTNFGTGARTPRATVLKGASRVIDIQGTGLDVTVDGFEITAGTTNENGAGIRADVEDDCRVVIHDNYIHDNVADNSGGGIWAELVNRCELQITANRITSNTAATSGGLSATSELSSTLVLDNNEIISNSAGETGGFSASVALFGRFSVDGNKVESNVADTYSYGGFSLFVTHNSHGTFDDNEVIDNGPANNFGGGRIDVQYNSSSTFHDNLFRDNEADRYGGLFINLYYNANLSGSNLKLEDNVADGSYGGAYAHVIYHSSLALPDSRITGNKAESGAYGGAFFYTYDNSRVDVPDLYVYDNSANSFGGVGLYDSDGNDVIIATNAQIISNTARAGDGGGAYVYADDGSLVDLAGSRFERNTASRYGGGLYMSEIDDASTLLLGHSQFLTNTAGSDGGGIYFNHGPKYNSYLELSHATFISNTAGGNGGGFYMDEVKYNIPSEVALQADHLTFVRNRASNDGGAFYLEDAWDGTGKLVFDDGVYQDNTADSDGGAVYWDECHDGCSLSMSRNRFEDNTAGGDGGAVYFYQAYQGSEVHFDDNKFYNNEAGGDGGAFYNGYFADDGGLGTFDRNELVGNSAGDEGGAVYFNQFVEFGGVASFNDNVVRDNQSGGDGGGVYLWYPGFAGGGRAEFKDNVIVGNVISSTSSYDGGGGVYFGELEEGSTLWMTGNVITGNVATGYGGGLYWDEYIEYGAVLYFEDNQLNDNYAGEKGGGCYFEDTWDTGSRVYFTDNEVNRNVAGDQYGACYVYYLNEGTTVDMVGNQFNDNAAGGDHGGLTVQYIDSGSVLNFWDNEVIGNGAGMTGYQVLGGQGGGLWLNYIAGGSIVDMRRNTILNNTAYRTGTTGGDYGGLYAYLSEASLLTMVDNEIAGNTAQEGFAGLAVDLDQSRLVMEDNLIEANVAVAESGGVYIYGKDDSQYYLRRNQVVDNTAGSKGGLWIENGDTTNPLWGLTENNLVAGNVGSGIFLWDADLRSRNDTIADNGAYGIQISGTQAISLTAWLSNTIVWNHTASIINGDPVKYTVYATDSDIQGGAVFPGAGNINANPLFVNPGANNYHLQGTSPAVNKVLAAKAPRTDLDGIPRPVPAGGLADMGCYEWFQTGVTLAPTALATTEKPGTTAVYSLTVTNDGDLPDTFWLTVPLNSLGWPVAVEPVSVTLAAGASAAVQVHVSVPAGADAELVTEITVQAASQADATKIGIATIQTTVALAPDVSIAPDGTGSAAAGTAVSYEHTVTNLGNGTETFALGAVSSQGWTATVSLASVNLAKGASTTVTVQVLVPSGTPVGTVDVTTVTATSASDAAVSDSATDTTTSEEGTVRVYLPLVSRNHP